MVTGGGGFRAWSCQALFETAGEGVSLRCVLYLLSLYLNLVLPAPCAQISCCCCPTFHAAVCSVSYHSHLPSCFLARFYPVASEASTSSVIHPLPFFCTCFVSQTCPVRVFEDLFKLLLVPLCVICVPWLSEHSALSRPSLASGALGPALEGTEHPKQSVQVCREPC